MFGFIGRRVAQMTALFVVFLTILFFLLQAQPGDFSSQFLDPNIPAENRAAIAARFGLDKSLWGQYLAYLGNFFTGDLGVSFGRYPRTVWSVMLERIPRTLFLFTLATLLSYWLGFVFGKILAWRRGGKLEYTITLGGVFLYTVFYPWFALMMIWLFGGVFEWVPINQFLTPDFWREAPFRSQEVFPAMIWSTLLLSTGIGASFYAASKGKTYRQRRIIRWSGSIVSLVAFGWYWDVRFPFTDLSFVGTNAMRPYAADIAHHSILPIVTLALIAFAGVMLITRGSMLETLREDYILTARAKGVPERIVRDRHAARNALLPVVTSFVLGLAFIIGGGLVTETVFSWPGMGELLLNSVVTQDIPVAIGALTMVGALALIAHIVVDVLYMFLDPRIRYQS